MLLVQANVKHAGLWPGKGLSRQTQKWHRKNATPRLADRREARTPAVPPPRVKRSKSYPFEELSVASALTVQAETLSQAVLP